jgi:hypothetical protein
MQPEPAPVGPVPHFEAGKWSTGPAWIDDRWIIHAGPMDHHYCPVRGYHRTAVDSLGMAYEITYWERREDVTDVPPYLLRVEGDHYVSAGSFPDLMDLLARWAPLVIASILTEVYNQLAGQREAGLLTDVLATVRANEGAIERERQQILRERAEDRRHQEKKPPWAAS